MLAYRFVSAALLTITALTPSVAAAAGSAVRVVTLRAEAGTQHARLTRVQWEALALCRDPARYNNCFRQFLAKFDLKPDEVGQESAFAVRFTSSANFRIYYTCGGEFQRSNFYATRLWPSTAPIMAVQCSAPTPPAAPPPPTGEE